MPRGKKIIIETHVDDPKIDEFRSIDLEKLKDNYQSEQNTLSSSVANIFKTAQQLYQDKVSTEDISDKHELFNVRSGYEYLKERGIYISFRAFGGRIERGTIAFVKVGRKRFIPKSVLDDVLGTKKEYYSVREAFEEYNKANSDINLRAFIGRVEKGSVPSVKFGTRRLIPRDAIEALTHVSNDYFSVTQAMHRLGASGIKIKRNAFERRLDRDRIPHQKVGGRRFIHQSILQELIDKEISLRTPQMPKV